MDPVSSPGRRSAQHPISEDREVYEVRRRMALPGTSSWNVRYSLAYVAVLAAVCGPASSGFVSGLSGFVGPQVPTW
jgi:hypothetical protein